MVEAHVINALMSPEMQVLEDNQRGRLYYTPEAARQEAQVLSQQIQNPKPVHIVKDHLDRSMATPSVDDIIGKVTDAIYEEGVGVIIQGEIVAPQIAMQLERGILGISPTPAYTLGEIDEAKDAKPVEDVISVLRVAVVSKGQPGTAVEVSGKVTLEDATATQETPEPGVGHE